MGQEAYAMFPMLAEASARAAALRQQTQQGGITFGQQQEGQNIFGQVLPGLNSGAPQVPGGAALPAPEPGAASVPNVRVPQPSPPQPAESVGGGAMDARQVAAAAPMAATPSGDSVAPVPQPGAPSPQGQPAAQGQAPQAGQPGSVSLDHFMQAAKKKFPNASGQALAQAANYYLPFMTEEDQARLKELLYTSNAAYKTTMGAAATENAQSRAEDVGSKVDYRTQVLGLKQQALTQAAAKAQTIQQYLQQKIALASAAAGDKNAQQAVQQARLLQDSITKANLAYSTAVNQFALADQNDPNKFAADKQQAEDALNATLANLNAQAQQLGKTRGIPTPGKQSMNTPPQGSPEWSQRRVALGMSARPYGGMNA